MDPLYEAELARAKERHEASRRERFEHGRARMLLERAGWDAPRKELEEVARHPKLAIHSRADQKAAVRRAIEMQKDERYTGRRIDPREEDQVGRLPKAKIDVIIRDAAELLRAKPHLSGNDVRKQMNQRHSVSISEGSWWNTYSPKVKELLGETAEPPSATDAIAEPAEPETAEEEPDPPAPELPTEVANLASKFGESLSDEITPPLVSVEQIGSGRVRVFAQIDTDFAAGMRIVAAIAGEVARLAGVRD